MCSWLSRQDLTCFRTKTRIAGILPAALKFIPKVVHDMLEEIEQSKGEMDSIGWNEEQFHCVKFSQIIELIRELGYNFTGNTKGIRAFAELMLEDKGPCAVLGHVLSVEYICVGLFPTQHARAVAFHLLRGQDAVQVFGEAPQAAHGGEAQCRSGVVEQEAQVGGGGETAPEAVPETAQEGGLRDGEAVPVFLDRPAAAGAWHVHAHTADQKEKFEETQGAERCQSGRRHQTGQGVGFFTNFCLGGQIEGFFHRNMLVKAPKSLRLHDFLMYRRATHPDLLNDCQKAVRQRARNMLSAPGTSKVPVTHYLMEWIMDSKTRTYRQAVFKSLKAIHVLAGSKNIENGSIMQKPEKCTLKLETTVAQHTVDCTM